MALRLITPPAAEPVTLDEAKKHMNVTHGDDDTYIAALIAAARAFVDGKDGVLGRALMPQTWELVLDKFPDDILVPLPPLISVQSVTYVDAQGIDQTLSADDYTVDAVSEPGWIVSGPSGWPSVGDYINAVTVRFTAGYTAVPANIKAALLLMIGHLYANREDVVTGVSVTKLPNASDMLLDPYRVLQL